MSMLEVLKCPFKEIGCNVVSPADAIFRHADMCNYAEYKCPFYCTFVCTFNKGNKRQLLEHLHSIHANDNAFVVSPFPTRIKISENEKRRGLSHFLLQYVGPKTWSERFRYSVTMRTSDGRQTLTEYSNTTHYNDNPYDVMRGDKCPWFYNSFIRMCLDQCATLWLEINAWFISLDKEIPDKGKPDKGMPDKEMPDNCFL